MQTKMSDLGRILAAAWTGARPQPPAKRASRPATFAKTLALTLATVMLLALLPAIPSPPAQAAGSVVTDWSGVEGDLYHYHEHSKGKGVPVIIMPVHFGPDDLAPGGKLQTAGTWAADAILGNPSVWGNRDFPFADFMAYIDVYIYIGSEEVSPVPRSGYVETFFEKYETAYELTAQLLKKDPTTMRMIYLGNSDMAGQVGGHAYGGAGALLSWGRNPENGGRYNWEGDGGKYWALHEFWGHAFMGMADEYPMDPYFDVTVPHVEASNMYVSESTPDDDVLPWKNFIGYSEVFEGKTYTIGKYHYPGLYTWRPTENGFLNENPHFYASIYHKWVFYSVATMFGGQYRTLYDFCAEYDITLPIPPDASYTDEDYWQKALIEGGEYVLTEDVSLTSQLVIRGNLTLDLNGKTFTVDPMPGEDSGIVVSGTLTITDSAGGGVLNVRAGNFEGNRWVAYVDNAAINTANGTLVVKSGTVNAEVVGGCGSAGIGSNYYQENNGTIRIEGGKVTAGSDYVAGIGGGMASGAGSVIITGGTVVAWGGRNGPDIGPGDFEGEIVGASGSVVITGGSVRYMRGATNGMQPTNGSADVYMTAVKLEGVNADERVTRISAPASHASDDVADMYTDEDGTLYLWLPEGDNQIALTIGGDYYSGAVDVTPDNKASVTLEKSVPPPTAVSPEPQISQPPASGNPAGGQGDASGSPQAGLWIAVAGAGAVIVAAAIGVTVYVKRKKAPPK
jgi:hypothetical protein